MAVQPPVPTRRERAAEIAAYGTTALVGAGLGALGGYFGYETSQFFYDTINSGNSPYEVQPWNDIKTYVDIGLTALGTVPGIALGVSAGRSVRRFIRGEHW